MAKGRILQVKNSTITVITQNEADFINLTDMTAGFNEGSGLIGKWITNKNTLEYLGVWEKINNANFNYPEFGVIVLEAGVNRFIMSAGQWIERTGRAPGLQVAFHAGIVFNTSCRPAALTRALIEQRCFCQ